MLEKNVIQPSISPWASPIVLVKKDGSTQFCVDYRKVNQITCKAFCTPEGLFEFNVMPFGFCNAPATFQRLINLILGGLQLSSCLVYLDDIIVMGRSFDEHLRNLAAVFDRIQEAGLKLKPSKCHFLQDQVKYLGHIVTMEGIAADPDKTAVIKEWPVPSCTKEVQ